MLTQFQTIEPQAVNARELDTAVLAACPRPRALAYVAHVGSIVSSTEWSHSAPIAVPAASARRLGLGIAQELRPFGATGLVERPAPAERQMARYAAETAVVTDPAADAVRPGFAAGGNGFASTTSTKQQDKQYLTARRGPVTWRPPH
jgi:hypothetical protein